MIYDSFLLYVYTVCLWQLAVNQTASCWYYRYAVAQEVERSDSNRNIGCSIFGSSSPHADVSLGKILNPIVVLMAAPKVYECVWVVSLPPDEQVGTLRGSSYHQCVNGWMWHVVWKCFEWSKRLEKCYISTVYWPFTESKVAGCEDADS